MDEKYIQMIIENAQSCKSAHHRLDSLEKKMDNIQELTVAVKEIAIETKANREDVNKMDDRIKSIEEKPGKRWEDLMKIIVTRNSNCCSGIFFSQNWFIERR